MPKPKTIKISDEVRTALSAAEVFENTPTGVWSLRLVSELDRKTYEAVNKVLVAAGGKWDRKSKAHLFAGDPRENLGIAVATGTIVDKKKSLGQFFTPAGLAHRIVALADVRAGDRVLEPSAGNGALAQVISMNDAKLVCVEDLPDDSFSDAGARVKTVLVHLTKPVL